MPDFYTTVTIPPASFNLDYSSNLFFLGSCFADTMGKRMIDYKFKACHNPFGVIYNPLSISRSLILLLEKEQFAPEDLSFHNELWFSYKHYTLFSDVDREACLNKMNNSFIVAKNYIARADILFITLGTSWVFKLKETGEIVNNCHKIAAAKFERFFSGIGQSAEALKNAILQIRKMNPFVKIVFSVSPVRHWKDGAIENQRSKAALIMAIAELQNELPDVFYFPAYEIFMDELRDYRFYAADKLHPSEEAQEYIWEKFKVTYIKHEAQDLLNEVRKILKSLNHKPVFPTTQMYRGFVESTIQSANKLSEKYPFLDFDSEIKALKNV